MARLTPLLLTAGLCVLAPGCIRAPAAEGSEAADAKAKAPKTAQEVLDRYVEALGGESVLRGLPERTVEARVVFRADEGCAEGDPSCIAEERVGQFVLYATSDGRLFRRMVVGERISERGFDGKTGWNLEDGQFLEIEGPNTSLASREDALLHWYLDLEAREIEPKLVEEARTRGRDDSERTLDGIEWQAAHGKLPARTLWFDRETGLLREEIEAISDDHEVVIIYDGYREVDGVQVPHEIRQLEIRGGDQKEIDILVQSAHHRELREGLFDIPELPPLEPEADPYLGALADARAAAEASPKDLQSQLNVARVAFAVAHFSEAREAAKQALSLNKKEPEAMWILGRVALLEGELRDAKRWFDKAAKLGLKAQEYSRHLAWIASHQRDWDTAAKALAVAGMPDLVEPYEALPGKPISVSFDKRACSAKTAVTRSKLVEAPVIEAEIEGKSVKLMLDTGTRDLILSEEIARELLITRDAESPIGASGGPPFPHGFIESMTLGDMTIANLTTAIVPRSALEKSAGGVDGVLGVRPLLDLLVEVDGAASTIEFIDGSKRCARERKKHQRGGSIPLYVHETHFTYLVAELNGAEGLFLLNTGMRGADVAASSGAYRRAGIRPPAVVAGEVGLAKVDSLSLGEARQVGNLGAAFGAFEGEATSDNFRLDGMLSLSALGAGPVVMDFPSRTLYLPEPEPEPSPAEK